MRKTKEDAGQTRVAILDAAEELFFVQGPATATLEGVARAAGLTRGAIYWHFKDKLDIMRALHARSTAPQQVLIRTAAETGHCDPKGLLLQSAEDMLRKFETDLHQQRTFAIMNLQQRDDASTAWLNEVSEDLLHTLVRLTEQASKAKTLSPEFTPKEAATVMMATMTGLLSEWLRGGKAFALSDLGSRLLHRQASFLFAS